MHQIYTFSVHIEFQYFAGMSYIECSVDVIIHFSLKGLSKIETFFLRCIEIFEVKMLIIGQSKLEA